MIYVLFFVGITNHLIINSDYNIDVLTFETKERCERNIEHVRKQMREKYDEVEVRCVGRKLNKGK